MLTELQGKAGCLCQPAKEGLLRCPLIVRQTSEDVITGNVFQMLKIINPRWWLPQMLNEALGAKRFRKQVFRKLRLELWKNMPAYPRELLPWDEGSTQVDITITWENPPTTVFIEAKYASNLTPKSTRDDGNSGFPSDQLIRNIRVGLLETGYFERHVLFQTEPRRFLVLLLSPHVGHELVDKYRHPELLRSAIPCSDIIAALPPLPFVGQLTFRQLIQILANERRWMNRGERLLAGDLIEYLEFKLSRLRRPGYPKQRHLALDMGGVVSHG